MRRIAWLALLTTLGASLAGCGSHTTLRRTLAMSPLMPVTPDAVLAAAERKFPLGTARSRVVGGLPPTDRGSVLTPMSDSWDVTMTDDLIGVISTDFLSKVGTRYLYIHFRFNRDRLRAIDVGRGSFDL